MCQQSLVKPHNIKFRENEFTVYRVLICGQTDMVKQIDAFLQLLVANVPKNLKDKFVEHPAF
jgi:hypothetical protein